MPEGRMFSTDSLRVAEVFAATELTLAVISRTGVPKATDATHVGEVFTEIYKAIHSAV